MAKGIFIVKPRSIYDDIPEFKYHFPVRYLKIAEECIGDWILYYEPRRADGRQVYFATARVVRIEPDPGTPNHFYAIISDYLEFLNPVPFREGDVFYESALRRPDGGVNKGVFRWAIHHIPDQEYNVILTLGMRGEAGWEELTSLPKVGEKLEIYTDRRIVEQLISRPYRDRAFLHLIRSAYDNTCALTGLRLVNGGGRPEVEAAHIRSVEASGPDSPRNGIALSRTMHWLFDRGVVSLEDDGRILSAGQLLTEPVKRLLRPDGFAAFPEKPISRPHKEFLRWHRENVFKG